MTHICKPQCIRTRLGVPTPPLQDRDPPPTGILSAGSSIISAIRGCWLTGMLSWKPCLNDTSKPSYVTNPGYQVHSARPTFHNTQNRFGPPLIHVSVAPPPLIHVCCVSILQASALNYQCYVAVAFVSAYCRCCCCVAHVFGALSPCEMPSQVLPARIGQAKPKGQGR